MAETLLSRAGGVVLTGETAPKIKAALLAHPNNDLGVEYCRAIVRQKCDITPVTVLRQGAVHDGETVDGIASTYVPAGKVTPLPAPNPFPPVPPYSPYPYPYPFPPFPFPPVPPVPPVSSGTTTGGTEATNNG